MEINGIEIKPGMVVTTKEAKYTNGILGIITSHWIAFPIKNGDIRFVNINEHRYTTNNFSINDAIVAIYDLSDGRNITSGKILWIKDTIELSMQEIADKFNINVNQLKIKEQ